MMNMAAAVMIHTADIVVKNDVGVMAKRASVDAHK